MTTLATPTTPASAMPMAEPQRAGRTAGMSMALLATVGVARAQPSVPLAEQPIPAAGTTLMWVGTGESYAWVAGRWQRTLARDCDSRHRITQDHVCTKANCASADAAARRELQSRHVDAHGTGRLIGSLAPAAACTMGLVLRARCKHAPRELTQASAQRRFAGTALFADNRSHPKEEHGHPQDHEEV